MKLGKREIDSLACPPDRREVLKFDDDIKGFAIRVTQSGAKVFLFEYWRDGRTHRMRIGPYGDLTPHQARKIAATLRVRVAAGDHPAAEKREARASRKRQDQVDAVTLAVLIDRWETIQLQHRSERYRREATRALRTSLAGQLALPADTITPAILQAALDAIPKRTARAVNQNDPDASKKRGNNGPTLPEARGGTMARRVRVYGHAMFEWGKARRLVSGNPFAAVVAEGRDRPRERWLTDGELAEVWRCAAGLGWPWGPYLRFLLLTLQREAETAGMRWSELDADLSTWTLPGSRTKNSKAHIVRLPEQAREILRAVPRFADSDLVFTTTGKTPISGFSNAKERLDRAIMEARRSSAGPDAAPLAPWRLHDFRRTGVTRLAHLGVRWEVADKILNHASGAIRGVAAIYQRHEYLAERATALATWAAHVVACGDGAATADNVIALIPGSGATATGA